MKVQKGIHLAIFGLLIICVVACGLANSYEVPQLGEDGWPTASLVEVGLKEKQLMKVVDRIIGGKYGEIHSILIAKDGKLVFETYFDGHDFDFFGEGFRGDSITFNEDTPHNLASVTKIFTATVVGIAIDRGILPSVEASVFDYFPEYAYLNNATKKKLQVEHLLTMTSGLECNQGDVPINDERNDIIQIHLAEDPIEFVLAKPIVAEPGDRFYYSEADVNLLSYIVQRATDQRFDEVTQEMLFEPLGIDQAAWGFINPDMVWASGDLQLRPRDMAKLGQLYLNGGVWNGQRILSQAWVDEATKGRVAVDQPHLAQDWGDRYGYHWFRRTYAYGGGSTQVYLRTGWGGQAIIVFPEFDMVVVFTGGNYEGSYMPHIQ
jgi:CubicO group peptidase (beta-lactamase class C family)